TGGSNPSPSAPFNLFRFSHFAPNRPTIVPDLIGGSFAFLSRVDPSWRPLTHPPIFDLNHGLCRPGARKTPNDCQLRHRRSRIIDLSADRCSDPPPRLLNQFFHDSKSWGSTVMLVPLANQLAVDPWPDESAL